MAILPELLIASPTLQDFLIGKDALPLAAGVVTCYRDNNRQLLKNWYYQSGTPGNYSWIALPNPLTLSAAGTIQNASGDDVIPFFYPWFTDAHNNTVFQAYFITVYNSNGELQFTRANFPFDPTQINPGPGTDIFTLENYVTNNRFWRNIDFVVADTIPLPSPNDSGIDYIQSGDFGLSYNNTPSPPHYYYITLAPSQNDGSSMPDFNYIKNAVGGNESISFLRFPATTSPVLTGDVMPEFYIEHICGSQDSGVSLKIYQYPVSLHLDTLAGQQASVSIQARSNTGGTQLTLALYQFQGTGNTSTQPVPFATFDLSSSWFKYEANVRFPSNLTTVDSLTGDDAWYLQIGMPINAAFEIDFTLPALYLNLLEEIPTNSFQSYDQIDTIISKPRTGDIRISLNRLYPYGWLPMNGGTIGNNTLVSPAYTPTARNNIDAWPLYSLLWSLFHTYTVGPINPIAQMLNASGANVAYGASALADWTVFNSITLTKSMGQVMLGTVPVTALLPSYTVTYNSAPSTITTTANVSFFNGMPVYITGTPVPTGLTINTIYYVSHFNGTNNFSLNLSFQDVMNGVAPITIGTIIGGTAIIVSALSGTYEGEYAHLQQLSELAQHSHNASSNNFVLNSAFNAGTHSGTDFDPAGLSSATGGITGRPATSAVASNVTQPGTFNNLYIKL